MGRFLNIFVKVAAVLGIAVAVKKLSEKENREAVKEEFNKAKEDPKSYAENLQVKVSEKANEYQDKAVEEYNKAKEDPKSYAENVQSKVTEQAKDYQSKVSEQAKHYQEVAKEEYSKAKDDPKAYADNVRGQAKKKADEVAEYATKSVDKIKDNMDKDDSLVTPDGEDITTELEEEKFQSEGNVHPDEADSEQPEENSDIHVVTKDNNDK